MSGKGGGVRLAVEPFIPSAMDDWDEAFWIATGIIVPGSTLFASNVSVAVIAPGYVGGEWRESTLYLAGHPAFEKLLASAPGTPISVKSPGTIISTIQTLPHKAE